MQIEFDAQRCAVVALIGAPNAGKSTLVNQLTGAKVSIVTHKVQTTRARIRGIALEGESQLVLVDTPGIFAPRRRLDRAMVEAAWGGARDADVTVLLIDAAKGLDADTESIIDGLAEIAGTKVLVLNKVYLVKKDALLELTAAVSARGKFDATFMISALKGDGVQDLRAYLGEQAPPGPWLYPEDQLSDLPERPDALEAKIGRGLLLDETNQRRNGEGAALAVASHQRQQAWFVDPVDLVEERQAWS